MEEKQKYYCQKCGKWMGENEFFTYKDKTKTEFCKKCLTMHIDNFDESTYLWLIQKMDLPYVPTEWNNIRDRLYEKDPDKVTSQSVFGRYLSKMKLNQWRDPITKIPYGWADTEMLQARYAEAAAQHEEESRKREAEAKEKFEAGEISEAEYKTLLSVETKHAEGLLQSPSKPEPEPALDKGSIAANEDLYMTEEEINIAADLTDEDKLALALKWGRLYKPSEWVELEKIYTEMTESFDIQDADTINTLILICKTNLKMNQSLDIGDVDGFQKLSRVSDQLRKSAKFTAAQNKEDKNDFVDNIGELVALCERDGFIPRYAIDIPQDKVDLTLRDMNDYLKKLVTQDLGFGQQIEDAIKKIQIQKEMNEVETMIQDGTEGSPLQDEDYVPFLEEMESQKQADIEMQNEKKEEEDK